MHKHYNNISCQKQNYNQMKFFYKIANRSYNEVSHKIDIAKTMKGKFP